jgi:YfiH family protein
MPMLERIASPCGVVTWRSPMLASAGFLHGFSTRHGGVSPAPFDSMNLGIAQAPGAPDTEENVAENASRLMRAIGAPDSAMVRVRQVHGCAVVDCRAGDRGVLAGREADALVSAAPSVAPCVRTADCVPVLVGCARSGAVAAIHAGWRGIVAGVVGRAVDAMVRDHGADPCELVAAIGPCIGRDVYEVGPEVAAEFAAAVGPAFVLPPGGPRAKEHIDCHGAVRAQLAACGIPPRSIDGEELCTVVNGGDFFSYRRDGARSGRMAAVIVPRAAPGA